MQANRDRFERKQLLQVFGEPDYDSPLLSASKTEQKRKASPVSTKDRSESSPSKRFPLLLSRKLSLSISNVKDLDVSVEELPLLTHMPSAFTKRIMRRVPLLRPIYWPRKRRPLLIPNRTPPSGPPNRATSGPTREAFKPASGSSSAKPRKNPSEVGCWTCGKKGHYSGDCPSNTKRKSLLSKNKPFRSLLAKQAFTPAQTQSAIRIMDTYNQSVCHNCLVHGCRGHNCDANDREIYEAISDVMAVLHENPDLQQATSTLITMTTTHSKQGNVISISTPTSVMKKTTNLLNQGARKWMTKQDMTKNMARMKMNLLWIPSSCLRSRTLIRFFLRHQKDDASCGEPTHGINTTSDLFWTLHNPAKETPLRIRGAICKAYREVKDPMDPNKWITITDHLDSCDAFVLVQMQYLHDIKPAAQYGMHSMNPQPIGIGTSERITLRTLLETSTFV
jgi:hypothetical protein